MENKRFENRRFKIKTLQVDNIQINYTHKVIPSYITIKVKWKQLISLIIKRNFKLQLNVYMYNDKIVHVFGEITN